MLRTPQLLAASLLLLVALAVPAQGQYVIDSIDVRGTFVNSLAYNPLADVVYGASGQSYYLFTISCDSGIARNRLYRDSPVRVVYDSIDNKAYFNQRSDIDSLVVVDGSTHQRIRAIPMLWAGDMAWNPTTDRLYVPGGYDNVVRVIDCHTDSVIATIPVSGFPYDVRLSKLHPRLYVMNWDNETVTIVNTETNQVIRTIQLSGTPDVGCYSADADKFYLGSMSDVIVIDGTGDTVSSVIPFEPGTSVTSVASVEGHGLLVVGTYWPQTQVSFVSIVTESVTAAYEVGGEPVDILHSPATGLVYSANANTNGTITAFADDGSRVVATVPVGNYPKELLLVPAHGQLYVGHGGTHWVYVIRDSTTGISDGPGPTAVRQSRLSAEPSLFVRCVALRCRDAGRTAASVTVFSQNGQFVRRLPLRAGSASLLECEWDGLDSRGTCVPAGVYIAVLDGDPRDFAKVVKLE